MSLLRNFRRSQSGNTAIIFSIAIVPMLLAAGGGIDMLRANNAHTALQAAVDAAAFAGGASEKANEAEIKAVAQNYLDANGASQAIDSIDKVIIDGGKEGDFSVTIQGKLKTSFMKLAGYKTMDIEATATVLRGTGGITEVALVLDTTGSM